MKISDAKQLISKAINEPVYDIFYICQDKNLFDYYIIYNNKRVKYVVSIDPLTKCVSGIWGK